MRMASAGGVGTPSAQLSSSKIPSETAVSRRSGHLLVPWPALNSLLGFGPTTTLQVFAAERRLVSWAKKRPVTKIHPGHVKLALLADCHKRTTQRHLGKLRALGVLDLVEQGGRGTREDSTRRGNRMVPSKVVTFRKSNGNNRAVRVTGLANTYELTALGVAVSQGNFPPGWADLVRETFPDKRRKKVLSGQVLAPPPRGQSAHPRIPIEGLRGIGGPALPGNGSYARPAPGALPTQGASPPHPPLGKGGGVGHVTAAAIAERLRTAVGAFSPNGRGATVATAQKATAAVVGHLPWEPWTERDKCEPHGVPGCGPCRVELARQVRAVFFREDPR